MKDEIYFASQQNIPLLNNLENKIFTIREMQVMLDSELAKLYQTETKYINRAVHRNPDRFPSTFAFQLDESEWDSLKFQIGTIEDQKGRGQHRKYLPWVFTEQGVAMLSAVSKQLRIDLKKHNSQYPEIKIVEFNGAHDRFLIIDDHELYHFGASLKDLGKKWFAFSRMDSFTISLLDKLDNL